MGESHQLSRSNRAGLLRLVGLLLMVGAIAKLPSQPDVSATFHFAVIAVGLLLTVTGCVLPLFTRPR